MQEINAIIENATRLQEELEPAYATALKELAEAEYAYKQANATHYLRSEGTVNERSAIAVQGSADELQRKLNAEAHRDFLKVKIEDARQVMSAYQSILSAHSRNVTATGRYTA